MNTQVVKELRIQALNLATAVMRERIAANAGTGTQVDILAEADAYFEFLRIGTVAEEGSE
jgi:hypothetical protein